MPTSPTTTTTPSLNGKWDHMMDQTHIGYTYWQEPPDNTMPAVKEIDLPDAAAMGVASKARNLAGASKPPFDVFNQQRRYIDVFNKGQAPFEFTATASAPWIVAERTPRRTSTKTSASG